MPRKLRIREVTATETEEVQGLAASRSAPVRLVQRARLIKLLLDEPDLSAKAAGERVGYLNEASSRKWVKRFNAEGVAGLEERERSGRPAIHPPATRSKLLDLVVQKPRTLGYPFERWTLARLQQAFEEREGVHLSDSTIWGWVKAEGLHWKRQQSWTHEVRSTPGVRGKKGAIIQAYLAPPPRTRVLCIDELGPLAVKTYPGAAWQQGADRATFEPDYGRRDTPVWVHGAFEPATGQATFVLSAKRDGASHIRLLEHCLSTFPSDRWLLIEDNLSIHHSRDVKTALGSGPEVSDE